MQILQNFFPIAESRYSMIGVQRQHIVQKLSVPVVIFYNENACNGGGFHLTKEIKKGCRYDEATFWNVVRLGFEPRKAEPKSAVLPLHHRTNEGAKIAYF